MFHIHTKPKCAARRWYSPDVSDEKQQAKPSNNVVIALQVSDSDPRGTVGLMVKSVRAQHAVAFSGKPQIRILRIGLPGNSESDKPIKATARLKFHALCRLHDNTSGCRLPTRWVAHDVRPRNDRVEWSRAFPRFLDDLHDSQHAFLLTHPRSGPVLIIWGGRLISLFAVHFNAFLTKWSL